MYTTVGTTVHAIAEVPTSETYKRLYQEYSYYLVLAVQPLIKSWRSSS